MSAAFDDELIFSVASTISTEARAFGNTNHSGLDFFTPNINPLVCPPLTTLVLFVYRMLT